MTKPDTTRTEHDHFVIRTVTYRVPVDKGDPRSVANAFTLLEKLPDVQPEDATVEVEMSDAKYWKRPKA